MLTISLSATDDAEAVELHMEHSLVSLSKWESHYEKPFFGHEAKTAEETGSYIEFMVIGDPPPKDFLNRMVKEDFEKITNYINAGRTATTFTTEAEQGPKGAKENITSELIYYWLGSFQIPFWPTETWHLNRVMTLVRIFGVKQSKPKKMTQQQIMERNRALNEQRRREMGTAG